ncbi:ABC transporter substrate-binding protein [Gorillibacterium sp. sgz5001074]|uniref:ABC transporter substrate-binding protein n=1 Tax=Gorillibacterium sp. sgz5001074 TaxID=3446695 RepID=UPI003F6742E0
MKKKLSMAGLALALTASVAAGCGSKDESKPAADASKAPAAATTGASEAPKKNVTVKIFQFKVEIAEQMNRLKAEYEASHPGVKLEIETVGGGADYGAALKAKFAAGDAPDIFNNGGFAEREVWMEHLEDLSGEPWVKDVVTVAKEPMTKDGKLYGMPLGIEGYGYVYNKDLFAKAGITDVPKTLSQLEEAAKKLQAAGITPFANGYQEWWILGLHNLNVAFANQKPDPDSFIKGLNDGSQKFKGNPVMENWIKLLDLTVKYGNKNPLTTDYNSQVTLFAKGEAAMMQQGNWTQVQINGISPNIKLGLLPMPIGEDAAAGDKLLTGVPNNWVVYNKSKVKTEAKAFLNWLVTSDTGKKYITKEFKFIPAFTNIPADPKDLGDIAADITKYSKDNKLLSWNFMKFPDGAGQEFGASMQAYVAGKNNKDQLFDAFQKTWDNLKKK